MTEPLKNGLESNAVAHHEGAPLLQDLTSGASDSAASGCFPNTDSGTAQPNPNCLDQKVEIGDITLADNDVPVKNGGDGATDHETGLVYPENHVTLSQGHVTPNPDASRHVTPNPDASCHVASNHGASCHVTSNHGATGHVTHHDEIEVTLRNNLDESETDSDHLKEPVGHCSASSDESFTEHQRIWESKNAAAQQQTIEVLKTELQKLQLELKSKSETCNRLSELRTTVDREIHDLTASLFQEAHKLVTEANVKRVNAEKRLKETTIQVDMLQAEVKHLKALVSSSTPSGSPSHQSYRAAPRRPSHQGSAGGRLSFGGLMGHRRNNSGDTNTLPNGKNGVTASQSAHNLEAESLKRTLDFKEVEPKLHNEFVSWRERHSIEDQEHPFLARVYREDIRPGLDFANNELAEQVHNAIIHENLVIEETSEAKPSVTECSLAKVPRICHYRVRIGEAPAEWHPVCQSSRNRIASICDFFTYLRYLNNGLIKCGVHDAYWEIVRLRKNMALARLGLGFISPNEMVDATLFH